MTTENEIKPVASAEALDGGRCAVDAGFGGNRRPLKRWSIAMALRASFAKREIEERRPMGSWRIGVDRDRDALRWQAWDAAERRQSEALRKSRYAPSPNIASETAPHQPPQ